MDLKTMKRIAEQEIFRYRDNRAYIQGVLDACGDYSRVCFHKRAMWVHAVELAKESWTRSDPLKASFFSAYYRMDHPRKRYDLKPTVRVLSMKLNVSESTLYKWRDELLTTVVLAAIQTGALHPYAVPASTEKNTDANE